MRFSALPRDSLINIFSRLSIHDVLSFSQASPCFAQATSFYLSITSFHLDLISRTHLFTIQSPITFHIRDVVISGVLQTQQLRQLANICPCLTKVSFNVPGRIDTTELHSFLATIGPHLKHFAVEFCGGLSGDVVLQALASNCPHLESVILRFASRVEAAEVEQLVEKVGETLKVLEFDSCAGVDDNVLKSIAKHCTQLQTLSVGGSEDVGDEGVEAIAYSECARTLMKLDIRSCMQVTDDGVYAIATCCKQLLYINLWRVCVTNYGVRAVAEGQGEWLQTLVIGDSIGINDVSIISISNNCETLKTLEMCGLGGVTDRGVMALFNSRRTGTLRLESLTVDRCAHVSCRSSLAAAGLWDGRWFGAAIDFKCEEDLTEEQRLNLQWIGQILRDIEKSKHTTSNSIEALMEDRYFDWEHEKVSSVDRIEDNEISWDSESSDSENSTSSMSSNPSISEKGDTWSNDCDSFVAEPYTSCLHKLSMRGTEISTEMWQYIRSRRNKLEIQMDVIDTCCDVMRSDLERLVQSPTYQKCTSAFCGNCLFKWQKVSENQIITWLD